MVFDVTVQVFPGFVKVHIILNVQDPVEGDDYTEVLDTMLIRVPQVLAVKVHAPDTL